MIRRILTLIFIVPVLGYCGLAVTRVSAAKREARALQKTLEPAISALQSRPCDKPALPGHVTHDCSKEADRFWLTFPDHSGVFLPSDLFYEYDSNRSEWALLDYSETHAATK